MSTINKIITKRTALILAMLIFLVSIASAFPVFAADAVTVAAWNYTAAPAAAAVPATSGVNQTDAALTSFKGITPAYSSTSLNISSGWVIDAYWQLSLSTKGYKDLTVSAKTRSSATGPKDFKMQYSTDGTTFNDITSSAYAITATSLSNYMPTVTLPAAAANCDNLLIRFVVTSNIGENGTSYPTGAPGPSNINNVIITGTADESAATKVTAVTASPVDGSSITAESKIALTCATEGAVIKYSVNDALEAIYTDTFSIDTTDPNITTYTVKAHAEKLGLDNSDTATFIYTKASKVAAVTASPATASSIAAGSKVTLSCATEGAAIKYSIDGTENYIDYNDDITLNTLPVTIKAYANKTGLANSDIVTFTYNQTKVGVVTASPNSGSAAAGSSVTLTCATLGASIKYSIDDGNTYNDYSSPIILSALPTSIKAYAFKNGLSDGNVATFNYTEKLDGSYNLYFGQLHSHTNISDGQGSITDAYSYAKNTAKVDFLAVTDHSNSFDNQASGTILNGSASTEWKLGHNTADSYTDANFVGIYGYEMTWSGGTGHINTFNTAGFESRETAKFKAADGLQQYYSILKTDMNSISQFNHPGSTFGDFNDFGSYDAVIDNIISLVEVGNGEGEIGSSGYFPSYTYYTRALDKGWHLAPANNQDNHNGGWGDSNTARTVVLADSLTRANIYDAMKNMRVYATEDNNLRIKYTLNNEIMGSSLSSKPSAVNINVDIEDPDKEAIGTVSVIANGGKVVSSKTFTTSKEVVSFSLPADYSYYYIRIDESDKDIAVTAPVWITAVEKLGIAKTTSSATMPVKDQEITIKSDLYNNETSSLVIDSLTYSIDGNVINNASGLSNLPAQSTTSYSFPYTFSESGNFIVNVQLKGTINGVEKIFNDVLKIRIADPEMVSNVVIDGTHANDYVTGYYANQVNNFTTLANGEQVVVNVEKTKLTDDILKNAQLLVISAPCKKTDAKYPSQVPSTFSDEDIAVIKRYVDNGGNLIVSGLADYQDGIGEYQSSTQLNKLLTAIGATSRINNDEVIDNTTNAGSKYRLAFNQYDTNSPYLQGVAVTQTYSFYSGCSISLDSASLASGKTKWLVKGHSTTESFDSNSNLTGIALPQGSVYALAVENLSGGGKMFIGGTVFISDYEVKATLDNYQQLQNSNYNITMNILNSIKKSVGVTPISTIRQAAKGQAFVAEGIVTAGTSSGNAFFDTIYIQDNTGGINIFPVSGMDIKVGQKVRVTGSVDEYQGDKELRVTDVKITDTAIRPLSPSVLSTKDAMDSKNSGSLIRVTGQVTSVKIVNNAISEFKVKDSSGTEARVFIDGYIGYSNSQISKLESFVKSGVTISAIGLASVDPDGARLRVRDKCEITTQTQSSNTIETTKAVQTTKANQASSTNTASVTSTAATAPGPKIGGTTGWTKLEEKILNTKTGGTVTIDMNGTTDVPKSILSDIKGKNVTTKLDFGTYSWEINGMDISTAQSVDLGVTYKPGVVSSDIVDGVAGSSTSIQLQLNYNGSFGFTGKLTVQLPADMAGQYANLYYYNPETKKLELYASALIGADGSATFNFSHASDYVVVMDKVPKIQNLAAGENTQDTAVPISQNALPYAITVIIVTFGIIAINQIKKINK